MHACFRYPKVQIIINCFLFYIKETTNSSQQKVFPDLPRAKAFICLCQLGTVFPWNVMLMTKHQTTDPTLYFLLVCAIDLPSSVFHVATTKDCLHVGILPDQGG